MKRAGGFSLIEIMVALVVVTIGLSAAISVSATHIDAMNRLEQQMIAGWVAKNSLVALRLNDQSAQSLTKGSERMAGRDWYWEIKREETFDAQVNRLYVSVSLNKKGDDPLAFLTGYLEARP